MAEGFQQVVRIRVPLTLGRAVHGVLLLAICGGLLYAIGERAVELSSQALSRDEYLEGLLRLLAAPALWAAVRALIAAGRCFYCTQSVWFQGDEMLVRAVGPLPPHRLSRHDPSARLAAFSTPWGRRFPGLRLPMGASIGVSGESAERLDLAPAFSLRETEELAALLNAVAGGRVVSVAPGAPWRVEALQPWDVPTAEPSLSAGSHVRTTWLEHGVFPCFVGGMVFFGALFPSAFAVAVTTWDAISPRDVGWMVGVTAISVILGALVVRSYYLSEGGGVPALLAMLVGPVVVAVKEVADGRAVLWDGSAIVAVFISAAAILAGFFLATWASARDLQEAR